MTMLMRAIPVVDLFSVAGRISDRGRPHSACEVIDAADRLAGTTPPESGHRTE